MYIEKISIKNFKAIEDMELTFSPGVNLLIGDNGVGKTSVLEAIAIALAGMLKGAGGVPVKNILQNEIRFAVSESGDASTSLQYFAPVEINCQMKHDGEEFFWKRIRMDENGNTRTKMNDDGIIEWMQKITNSPESTLPLLCFQSDARVWQMRRGDFGKELKKKLNDRRCGYIGALDYSLDIKGIQEWCLKMEINAFHKKQEIQEYELFKKLVAAFMKNISELESEPEVYYSTQFSCLMYKEGVLNMPIFNLSAGYQSLLWMVMNLAYRLALLNPDKIDHIENIPGIVLIDEIDMHLHPKWQWNIINALEKTFPSLQFIVATHSPIVISSCDTEQMIRIDQDQEVSYPDAAYGFSVEDVLLFRQGTTERPKYIKALNDEFEDAIDNDELEQAQNIIDKMIDILGEEHSDIKRAQAELELNRWEEE